jgi:hypothetical protein
VAAFSASNLGDVMRIQLIKPAFWLLLGSIWLGMQIAPAIAADGDAYIGSWAGTWSGDNTTGQLQLTLERSSDGKVTGSIAVQQDGGGSDYTAKLKNVGFSGDKFTAAYEPPDGASEITLKGMFSAQGANGDWSLGAKDQPANPPVATGVWKIHQK